jgi:hypothetical protein
MIDVSIPPHFHTLIDPVITTSQSGNVASKTSPLISHFGLTHIDTIPRSVVRIVLVFFAAKGVLVFRPICIRFHQYTYSQFPRQAPIAGSRKPAAWDGILNFGPSLPNFHRALYTPASFLPHLRLLRQSHGKTVLSMQLALQQ